jgi:hypothetical protein
VFKDHIPTIHDVAREAHVSLGIASKALNRSGKLMIRRHGRCCRTISGVA